MRLVVVLVLATGSVVLAACGAAPAPAKTPDVPAGSTTRDDAGVKARADLDDGEKSLEASTSECGTACKALASMERAQATLCQVADENECERAKQRVEKARVKVKSAGCTCSS
jgi:hypothetical protein